MAYSVFRIVIGVINTQRPTMRPCSNMTNAVYQLINLYRYYMAARCGPVFHEQR